MQDIEIARLHRFSLGMGLVVLVWALAGISLEESARITPFGLPFHIARPSLFPIGLAVGALYGLVRYYYYALMLGPSPYRIRRDLLDKLLPEPLEPKRKIHMYWGHTEFQSTPWHWDRGTVEGVADALTSSFPKFARARVSAQVTSSQGITNEGEEYVSYAVTVKIPVRCRMAALFQDLDYSSPVWFNVIALGVLLVHGR